MRDWPRLVIVGHPRAIPFRGAEPDLENHWVPTRNRAQPSVMAFVAQAVGWRVLCYASSNLLREEADRMVPKFADYWKKQTGFFPARLLFDSRATTYAGLNQLTKRRIGFITIRRRGSGMLTRVERLNIVGSAVRTNCSGRRSA
ncbi:MAG: hypothetical protein ACP5XB_32400, partial [Isosphaeraceae bacterium]